MMRKRLWLLMALVGAASPASSGDLAIANGRIVTGTGKTIDRGTLVIHDGRIASISPGAVPAAGTTLDVTGLTVLPGLIDTHRHDLLGDLRDFAALSSDDDVRAAIERETPKQLRALLAEGFTTVMMPGVYLTAGLEVRARLADGRFAGPRLLFSGPGFCAPDDFPVRGMVCGENEYCAKRVAYQVTDGDPARAWVEFLADEGVDAIKVFVDDKGNDLTANAFAGIVGAAQGRDLPVLVHAHRVADMLHATRAGADRLVHTPGDARIADGAGAKVLRRAGVGVTTAVSFTSPQFAKAMGFPPNEERHATILANVRHLVDEKILVAFGTDSPPGIRPMAEVEELRRVLSPAEIVAAMTRDAARFLYIDDAVGTLEPGKVADIVVFDGNPLDDVTNLARVVLVLRDGRIVVDNR